MSDYDHEHIHDGCLCGCDPLADHEITQDEDLPAARGGVQGDRMPRKRKPTKTSVAEEA